MRRRSRWVSLAGFLCLSACGTLFESKSSNFVPAEPTGLLSRIQAEPEARRSGPEHYAVLIGANTELRHRGNLSLAYQVLLEQGYDRDRIYVLESEGETPFVPFTDFTTRASVRLLFEHLSEIVERQDTLLVYVTGHGRRITAEEDSGGEERELSVSTLMLNPGEEMSRAEFDQLLERVEPEVGIVFFDQCYWGPSARTPCNYVTITTSDSEETSHGVSFPRAFWRAFRSETARSPLTVLDAFTHAMVEDPATRRGQNRPRISYDCVNPSRLLLLGTRERSEPADTTRVSLEAGPLEPEETLAEEPSGENPAQQTNGDP